VVKYKIKNQGIKMQKQFRNIALATMILSGSLYAVSNTQNKVYAVVNGEKITQSLLDASLAREGKQFQSLPQDQQKQVLKQVVDSKILSQYALKTNAVKDPMYIEAVKNLKEDLALQVWMKSLRDSIEVSSSDMKSFYKNNSKLFKQPEQYKARHILVKTKKEAQNLIDQLKKSTNVKGKFIALAKKYSTGPSATNGGDLGWFALRMMVPEFGNALKKMKIGSFTKSPVKSNYGFHVIYLEDKKPASTIKYEQIKDKIKATLVQKQFLDKIKSKLNTLSKKAKVEYK
jgi:parvulin-like peptidyl-prolyl isomerase